MTKTKSSFPDPETALKLLYLAPERLASGGTDRLLVNAGVSLIAVDEAHCISEWGHDFRPEYRQLRAVRDRLPQAVCLALTATATPRVQHDIRQILGASKASLLDRDRRWVVVVAVLLILVIAVGAVWYIKRSGGSALFKTAEVTRDGLTVIVTATGTLEPVNQVDVGVELSGLIRTVEADVNDIVKKGQVLARLDTERLTARVVETRAAYDAAKAKLEEAKTKKAVQ